LTLFACNSAKKKGERRAGKRGKSLLNGQAFFSSGEKRRRERGEGGVPLVSRGSRVGKKKKKRRQSIVSPCTR